VPGLIDRLVGEPDEVKGTDAPRRGGFLVGRVLEGDVHIQADGLKFRYSLGPELVKEGHQGGGALACLRPDNPTLPVVVGYDGQVAMAIPIGDLVNSDSTQSLERVVVEHVTHDVDDDLGDGLPTHAQQLGDRGLRTGDLRQESVELRPSEMTGRTLRLWNAPRTFYQSLKGQSCFEIRRYKMKRTPNQRKQADMPTLHIEHAVPSFDGWKKAFESDPADRKRSGVRRYRISQSVDDPNYVTIDLDFDTIADARGLLAAMEKVWAGPGKAFMVDPKAHIVEITESVEL